MFRVVQPLFGIVQNLKDDLQGHQLTIQQLTQQVQALTSLKRSRSTSDQPASDLADSGAVSHATDIQVDTFPGLEANGSPQTADSTAESGAVTRGKPTIRTVDLGDEVSTTFLTCSQGHANVQQPALSKMPSFLPSCALSCMLLTCSNGTAIAAACALVDSFALFCKRS